MSDNVNIKIKKKILIFEFAFYITSIKRTDCISFVYVLSVASEHIIRWTDLFEGLNGLKVVPNSALNWLNH